MKNMMSLVSAILLSAAPAVASLPQYPGTNPGMSNQNVTYLSWCLQNHVVVADSQGNPVSRANCSNTQQVCVQEERLMSGDNLVIAATCQFRR